MIVKSFIISRSDYQISLEKYLNGKEIEYIINQTNYMVFRYHIHIDWISELSLIDICTGMIKIIDLNDASHRIQSEFVNDDYILVTHYSNFFKKFKKMLIRNKIKYVMVENPKNRDNYSRIMFNLKSQYGPNCYENIEIKTLFGKLNFERHHEFPFVPLSMINEIDAGRYAQYLAKKLRSEIISNDYTISNGDNSMIYVKLVYDRYDVIDICNCVLSGKTINNVIILMGNFSMTKRMRIPLLITKEICRQNKRDLRMVRL